jgi:hypothetical protein
MTEWRRLSKAKNLVLEGDAVVVRFSNGRSQRIAVEDLGDSYRLSTRVVRASMIEDEEELALMAWQRNRRSGLVGFRLDSDGDLVADAWVPKAGLTASEFQLQLQVIGTEADRFEYALTGADRE